MHGRRGWGKGEGVGRDGGGVALKAESMVENVLPVAVLRSGKFGGEM